MTLRVCNNEFNHKIRSATRQPPWPMSMHGDLPFRSLAQAMNSTTTSRSLKQNDSPARLPCIASKIGAQVDMPMNFSPSQRSEEHTSELQSLLRISYAVFCLKKK